MSKNVTKRCHFIHHTEIILGALLFSKRKIIQSFVVFFLLEDGFVTFQIRGPMQQLGGKKEEKRRKTNDITSSHASSWIGRVFINYIFPFEEEDSN